MNDEKNFPQEIGETFLEAFGKPTDEEWAKMDTKQRIEAVANVHREKRDFERQAKGFQFEAVLLKRDALKPHIERCKEIRGWLDDAAREYQDSLKKVIEFIECIDEP